MRTPLLVSLSLVTAAALAVACRDGEATAPHAAQRAALLARSKGEATSPIAIPAPHGFVSTVLARGSFLDSIDVMFRIKQGEHGTTVNHVDDPTQMVMAKITVAPGGAFPWHMHPGPALVTVAAGEIAVVHAEGCVVHRYAAAAPGAAGAVNASFMEPGQRVHVGVNTGAVETVLYVTYLDVPVGTSPLIPVDPPGC